MDACFDLTSNVSSTIGIGSGIGWVVEGRARPFCSGSLLIAMILIAATSSEQEVDNRNDASARSVLV